MLLEFSHQGAEDQGDKCKRAWKLCRVELDVTVVIFSCAVVGWLLKVVAEEGRLIYCRGGENRWLLRLKAVVP